MAMQTTIERVHARVPITILSVSGELDASNYLRLIDDVRPLYASGERHLLLDLRDLTFISSSGLVALYSILRIMQGDEPPDPEYGWSTLHAVGLGVEDASPQNVVRLAGVQPAVGEVLRRTGLDTLFHDHPDRESALAAF